MWKLFIDDEKFPVNNDWEIARSSQEAIQLCTPRGPPNEISFDYDLVGDDTSILFIQWLIDMMNDSKMVLEKDFTYSIHSQNPVGIKNIEAYMQNLLKTAETATLKFPEINLNDNELPKISGAEEPPQKTDEEVKEECFLLIKEKMSHLYKALEVLWGYPDEFDMWIDKLWLDDRGNRQGFPPEVMSALIRLSMLHAMWFGSGKRQYDDVWSSNNKLI